MSSIVKSGGGAAKQEKTVTAGTYVKEVLPDTGKLLSRVVVNPTPTEEKTVTPTTSQQTVSPSEGKHLAKVIINAMEDVTPEVTAQTPIIAEIIEGLVGKAQGATASAETILKGFSAYVGQKLVDGEYNPVDVAALFGCTKYAVDKFKYTSSTSMMTVKAINHSLGEKPMFAFIVAENKALLTATYDLYMLSPNWSKFMYSGEISESDYGIAIAIGTAELVNLQSSSYAFAAGVEYTLITMA